MFCHCGFFLIDKPKGAGSFFVVKSLRKVLDMKRIGYAGTLDPLATGLMIVAAGEATKLLYALEQTDKVYDVVVEFGATSETYDSEGPIHPFQLPKIPRMEDIQKVLDEQFAGERTQIPPRYSAVKIAGKHAYDLVRKGHDVTIPAKKVVFFDVQILKYEFPALECSVHCSAGTYIRSFAHDLGQILGCGAYVRELRRVSIGPHKIENAVGLGDITTENFGKFLQPPEKFLSDWRQSELTNPEYDVLANGGFVRNRWGGDGGELTTPLAPALALLQGKTVGLLESCEGGKSIKFAKKFVLR